MLTKQLRIGLWITLLLSNQLLGRQEVVIPTGKNGPLPSVAELLRRHNIELTQASLIQALANESGEVRLLAAQKLAEDRIQRAVPAIESALCKEEIPGVKVNIAFALAQLGDVKGLSELKDMCNSGDLAPYLRLQAAEYSLHLHELGCLNSVLNSLSRQNDDDIRIQALSLLPLFNHVGQKDLEKIRGLARSSLVADTPGIRMAASHAISALEDVSAIPDLQRAIANEEDEVIRSQMESDLKTLEREKK